MQLRAAGVGDHGSADDDGVAGKASGFFRADCDQLRHLSCLSACTAVIVERRRDSRSPGRRQRAEARVEVIVIRIDQLERNHAAAEHLADLLMAAGIAADAIAGKERVAAEQGVAGPFEVQIVRHVAGFETVLRAARPRRTALRLAAAGWRKRAITADLR